MKKYILIIPFCSACVVQAARIFIENKGTFPIKISHVVVPDPNGDITLDTHFSVQTGQSLPLKTTDKPGYDNFKQIAVQFNVDGYENTETHYFPDDPKQEASLSFRDSGYKRYPFNILSKYK